MHETTCPCGATVVGHQKFCASCGTPAGALPSPLGSWAELEPRLEAGLRAAMIDIDDGHLGLWIQEGRVTADRAVAAALSAIDWPLVLQQRGRVRPVPGTQPRLWPTEEGTRVALAARRDRAAIRAEAGPDL